MGEGGPFDEGVSGHRKTMNHQNDSSCRDYARERAHREGSEMCCWKTPLASSDGVSKTGKRWDGEAGPWSKVKVGEETHDGKWSME